MSRQRTELRGVAAAAGVAVGPALVVDAGHHQVPRFHIYSDDVPHQVDRLRRAIDHSRRELMAIRGRLGADAPADYRLILDAHMMMHRDELLIDAATTAIREDLVSAEWAVDKAVAAIASHLSQAKENYFRDRASDVQHVGQRIISQLVGRSSSLPPAVSNAVLVLDDLHPADVAQLIEMPLRGLVTGLGTATSHTAILARALDIPAVVGVTGVTQRVGTGDTLIVDGLRAAVVLNPSEGEQERARARGDRYIHFTARLREDRAAEARTADGVKIQLMANVDLPVEASQAKEAQAEGIGLYRTEFLFLNRPAPPTETEQAEVYSEIVRMTAPSPVTIRTVDIGGDSMTIEDAATKVPNPAMGLRASRLAHSRPDLLETQLRAVMRAATSGPVRVMFPLISGPDELREVKACFARAQQELATRNVRHEVPHVGVMIELPSAVLMAEALADECDFFSVGTNDLLQYSLGVDRTNPDVAYLANSLHPALLRQLDTIARVCTAKQQPLSMCGDMASDPLALALVVGLGFRSLSAPPTSLPLVREVLRRIDAREARIAASRALTCTTSGEVRELIHDHFHGALHDVWAEAGIEPTTDAAQVPGRSPS